MSALAVVAVLLLASVVTVAFIVFWGRPGPPPTRPVPAAELAVAAPHDAESPRTEPVEVPIEQPVEVPIEQPVEQPTTPEIMAPSCPDFSGHWAGTWGASTSRGTWTADFTQRPADEGGGTELHGDIRVRGTSCGTGGHIVGRILEDCSVEFDPYRTGPCRVRYQARFEGDRLSGSLAATGFGMADSGSWRGTRRGPVATANSR